MMKWQNEDEDETRHRREGEEDPEEDEIDLRRNNIQHQNIKKANPFYKCEIRFYV